MKRLAVIAVLLVAGTLIAARLLAPGRTGSRPVETPERARVREFWECFNRAGAARVRGDFAGAMAGYRAALALDPHHEDSLYYLGISAAEAGDYALAAEQFRQLVAVNPESGRGWAQLGRTLGTFAPGAAADFDGAREALHRALQINREQAGPLLQLGAIDLNQGRLAEAEHNFRVAAASGSPEARYLLGHVLVLRGRGEEAAILFHGVVQAWRADRKMTGQGVLSEGDLPPAGDDRPLSALERAGIKSTLLLRRLEGGSDATGQPLLRVAAVAGFAGQRAAGRGAWADFDRDGEPDLAVGGPGPLALYRDHGGSFADVAAAAGLAGARGVWEPHWADVNGDGYPDLYLVTSGWTGAAQNLLFVNRGDGRFRDATAESGLAGKRATLRACFFDANGDGRPDLLEAGKAAEGHSAIRFFENTGPRFVERAAAGLEAGGTAVDCAAADYDGDGRTDVYVQLWRGRGLLFRNLGAGRFAESSQQAGVAGIDGERYSAVFFDYDRDGKPDLLVSAHASPEETARALLDPRVRSQRNTARLFHNVGGRFADVTAEAGLDTWYGAVQVLPADFDGDGWPDLLLADGGPDAQQLAPSVLLRNEAGRRFTRAGVVGGAANVLGAAAAARNGAVWLYLAPNPVLAKRAPGGVFAIQRLK